MLFLGIFTKRIGAVGGSIALAVSSVFVSSMLFRYRSEKERQQNTTTEMTWTLPRSQEQ